MTPLEREIRTIIETEGPMTVSDYMQLCLAHPRHGYYVTRDPLGAGGDFVTAPEVSQMFGELIGAWAAAVWQQMGSPRKGASRRAWAGPRHLDGGCAARRDRHCRIFALRFPCIWWRSARPCAPVRRQTLASTKVRSAGIDTIEVRPDGPAIVIANEFVDALRVHQFVKDSDGWHLRVVGIVDGKLGFHGRAGPMPIGLQRRKPRRAERRDPGTARRSPIELCRARIVGRWRRGADHRLRPCESWLRRHAAGGAAHNIADPLTDPGRSRPHRAGEFRRACRVGAAERRGDVWPGPARRIPAPARHRASAPQRLKIESNARSSQPISTRRSRA